MANIKSQKKRIITAEKARMRNKAVRSELKTAVKDVRAAVTAKDADAAQAAANKANRLLDKAASKGIIHKNQASNRKSGVQKLVNSSNGAVYAWIAAGGSRSEDVLAADAGLFISASMRLYRATGSGVYLSNAKKTADLLVAGLGGFSSMSSANIDSISRGIAMRCLAELARRPGCEKYREYILSNARSAWTSRRLSDGINGPDWTRPPLGGEAVAPRHAVAAAVLYFAASRACR